MDIERSFDKFNAMGENQVIKEIGGSRFNQERKQHASAWLQVQGRKRQNRTEFNTFWISIGALAVPIIVFILGLICK